MTESETIQDTLAPLVLDTMTEGLLGLDQDKRITIVNRAAEYLLGWTKEELQGQGLCAMLQPKRRDGTVYLESESPVAWLDNDGGFYLVEDIVWGKDGRLVEVELSGIPLFQPKGNTFAFILLRDITEIKDAQVNLLKAFQDRDAMNKVLEHAQSQLLQADKLASVGQLAAGVAHEINNPIGFVNSNLNSLKGYVQDLLMLLETYKKAEPALAGQVELLADIEQAKSVVDLEFLQEDIVNLINESLDGVDRVKKIVDNLKEFSRIDNADWQFANLERGLDSTLNIVWNELKYKAEVVKKYVGLPEIECIASQLNQVFMNLMVNAAHAIEERGIITLCTGFDESNVWVDVADTGKGIKPEHLNKIFEPFFTTKPVGKGTGLGLSLAYGIVQRHHGRLEVNSERGTGTTFRITLPRVRVHDVAP